MPNQEDRVASFYGKSRIALIARLVGTLCRAPPTSHTMVALLTLLAHYADHERVVEPTIYIKAAGEGLAITILVSALITSIVQPEFFLDNPSMTYLGYNNPCVPWDAQPATFVAVVLFSFMVYSIVQVDQAVRVDIPLSFEYLFNLISDCLNII